MASNLAQTSVWRDEAIRFQRSKVKVLVTSWHPINVKAIHFRNTLTERLQLRQKRLGPTSEAIRSKWLKGEGQGHCDLTKLTFSQVTHHFSIVNTNN